MRQVLLLRGVNIGSRNRIAMDALREVLTAAGFGEVRTYLQSGNVALSSDAPPETLARDAERLISESFGLHVAVIARTRADLAAVVDRNPLAGVASDPRRYQVSFLVGPLPPAETRRLATLALAPERLVVAGRELYSWHPAGVARSKLWNALASGRLPVTASSRNWSTVTALLALADE